jgi:hypothetical protein
MVERHQLRRIIEETVQRHAGAGATTAPPEAAETGTVAESTAVIETPVAWRTWRGKCLGGNPLGKL